MHHHTLTCTETDPDLLRIQHSKWLPVLFSVLLLSGCHGKDDAPKKSTTTTKFTHSLLKATNTAEFWSHLIPGMTTNSILEMLGEPGLIGSFSEKELYWHYFFSGFPADDDMRGTDVIGVRIDITNGCLVRFGFAYSHHDEASKWEDLRIGSERAEVESNAQPPPALNFFIISDTPVAGGRQVDTPQFPKLGFISASPDLVLTRLESASLSERVISQSDSNKIVWEVGISLVPEDASRCASLTSSNLSRKIYITSGNVPVAAPFIRMPLTGRFAIGCTERVIIEAVRSNFARMQGPQ